MKVYAVLSRQGQQPYSHAIILFIKVPFRGFRGKPESITKAVEYCLTVSVKKTNTHKRDQFINYKTKSPVN